MISRKKINCRKGAAISPCPCENKHENIPSRHWRRPLWWQTKCGYQRHSSRLRPAMRIDSQLPTRIVNQLCKPGFVGLRELTTATIMATSLRPNVCEILALTIARKPMKKTLRPKKIADTMMTVGPCDAATCVMVVVDVVVDISDVSHQYSLQINQRN